MHNVLAEVRRQSMGVGDPFCSTGLELSKNLCLPSAGISRHVPSCLAKEQG